MQRYSITTTLPYVNADPHIGFALEIVQADMLARWHAQHGALVVFNTGTDEHGKKIYERAHEAGEDPKTYCDRYAVRFHGLKDALNLTYTHFIRTTDERHIRAAQEFWQRCYAAGDIYKQGYSVKYCVGCEMEKIDSELVDGRCSLHPNRALEMQEEENYFFRWSKYQHALLTLYDENREFVVPKERLNEIRAFVASGLKDFSISRRKEKMPWGVSVPNDADHVMYVWFDALVNYISTLGWPDENGEFALYWPMVQVAGRDNLRQQAAMWQAMLMSAGIASSRQIFIHGFITAEGQKMSKSLGNVVNPYDIVHEFGTDATRFYLLATLPSYEDGDFSLQQMEEAYAKLANGLGNLVSRVSAMAQRYFDGRIIPDEDDSAIHALRERLKQCMKMYDFRAYGETVWTLVDAANLLIERESPFKTVKTDPEAARSTLAKAAGMIRWIANALAPMMPETSEKILVAYREACVEAIDPLFPRRDVVR